MSQSAFTRDTRAVAPVVGFILMIGILVLLLAVYQAQVVPQQNAAAELEHHEDTRNELRSLHNAIAAVGADQSPRFQSITLGTAYESRTLGVNPTPPAGTIRTEQHNISIVNGNNSQTNISTQFIEYQPGYNELSVGSTWYENSVLYLDERERGNELSVVEDQNLVEDGNVTIVAVQNEFQETGTGRVTLALYPQNGLDNVSLPEEDGNYTVEVPTRINETEYWDEALVDAGDIYQGVDDTGEDDPDLLNLSVEPDALDINSVGIRLEPDDDIIKNEDDNKKDAENITVPEDPDGNQLSGSSQSGDNGRYFFRLENTGENDLTIKGIEVINTSSDTAERVEQVPLSLEGFDDDDLIDGDVIEFETEYDFQSGPSLDGGETSEEFEFDRFVEPNPGGGYRPVDVSDESINVTIVVENEEEVKSATTIKLTDE